MLPVFEGFNVVQIFCTNDIINVLTDTGDIYYSLFNDLSSYQTEALFNKNIVKITGCTANNKCVAMSESGDIFEWNVIKTAKTTEEKKENEDEAEKIIFEISTIKEWTEIDVKIIDIAITSTAYVAITTDQKLIVWGDYDKIYSTNVEDKGKKSKKKNDKKKNDKKKKDEVDVEQSTKPYLFIETEHKYTKIVSCLNNVVVLDENGNLYSFGFDEKCGALGLGPEISESLQPKLIKLKNDDNDNDNDIDNNYKIIIKSISSWTYGCIAIDDKSNIWYWGKRFSSKNDHDDDNHNNSPFYSPTKIEINSKYNSIKKAMVTNVGGFLWY